MSYAVSFAHVCARLGISERPRSWQLKHLAHLVAHHGFPPHLPAPRCTRAGTRHWDARAVDQWFDDLLTPAACRQSQTALADAAASTLDARAMEFAGRSRSQPERIHA